MKNKTTHKTATPVILVDENISLEEQIAQRAHELWLQRGGEHGNDLDDWLHAENEINEWHRKRFEAKATRSTSH